MKRILMVLALAAAFVSANAQVKSVSAAEAAVAKAKADVDNPKKASKFATWAKYGQTLLDAYNAPAGNGWLNASKQELQLVMGNDKPIKVEQVQLPSGEFEKEVYATKNYYFSNGILQFIEITKPIFADALSQSADAYAKAAELDVKGSKAKDFRAALSTISGKLNEEAYTSYYLGDYATASKNFGEAARVAAIAPNSQCDSNAVYNAGFTAWLAGDLARAEEYLLRSRDIGYLMDGDVYAKLSDVAEKNGKTEASLAYLEEGFQKFPQNQGILVGLINYYLNNNNGNTDRLFELLGEAKKNEPNNASLYYVEGNICSQLGRIDDAVVAYDQCAQIDPSYAFGYIGKGQMFYNEAVKYSTEAQDEPDYKKYLALVDKSDAALEKCVEPFEKAYNLLSDQSTKVAVAEYLKFVCYRLSAKDSSFEEKYKMYDDIVKAGQAQ